jgi:hypothetical protein
MSPVEVGDHSVAHALPAIGWPGLHFDIVDQ